MKRAILLIVYYAVVFFIMWIIDRFVFGHLRGRNGVFAFLVWMIIILPICEGVRRKFFPSTNIET